MKLKKLEQAKVKGKKVFLRVDFNLPISAQGGSASGRKNGKILDDTRIREILPTIEYLINKKAKIILASHRGRPLEKSEIRPVRQAQGRPEALEGRNPKSETQRLKEFSLRPIAEYFNKLQVTSYKLQVTFIADCLGPKVEQAIEKMKPGEIVMLENLRFYPEEEENDLKFAKKLADLAEIYVNDAFAVSHRANASVSAITKFLPSYAGLLLEKEIKNLTEVLNKPEHPFVVLLGGAKVSTKIGLIKNLAKIADKILIGGALANNFLAASGFPVGNSLYEKEMIETAQLLVQKFKNKIVLPKDVKVKLKTQNSKLKTKTQNSKLEELNKFKDFAICDIGDETAKLFAKYLKSAKMIVFNGPMGLFEEKPFDRGTKEVIKVILANKKAKIVIGGGETIACFRQAIPNFKFLISKNIFISTGGGAMLEFLEGKVLPGIKPLLR